MTDEQAKRPTLEQEILRANREEAEDMAYWSELVPWDVTLHDGLDCGRRKEITDAPNQEL